MDKRHFLNTRYGSFTKFFGHLAGHQTFGFQSISLQVGSVASKLHRHFYEEECAYVFEGTGAELTRPNMFQVQVKDFIYYFTGSEAHDLRQTDISNDLHHCRTTLGFLIC